MRAIIVSTLTLSLIFVIVACDANLFGPDENTLSAVERGSEASSMTSSAADFPTWRQNFNHNTDSWLGNETEGAEGWCGTVEQKDRRDGDLSPSVGRGYAVATGGACNDHWGGEEVISGPYSPGAGHSNTWPASGYITNLDVYLDPDSPTEFNYFLAISLLDIRDGEYDLEERFDETVASLRYFMTPVAERNGDLIVGEGEDAPWYTFVGEENGYSVEDAGWYTFRHRLAEDADGSLSVTFEVDHRNQTVFSTAVVPDYEASNVGTGYIWLGIPGEGDELPIDNHQVRRGR